MMFATRRIISQPFIRVAARQLQATSRRHASTGPPNMAEMMYRDPKLRDTFEKLARHPGAILAMQNISQIIQNKGFQPGKMPSKMDMLKLMMDKEFREAAQKLTEEMQNAGVEINPDVFMKMMEADKSK
ncbi:unnamed protein product [Clonostachys solani]|uniref:Uncharacterized protein n=1 Tax=Clonostachys solani TaxID=160281 RepID=A0A9P0EIQ0_9HYPO|nr:unnamed protein product [Clonostachys solani]